MQFFLSSLDHFLDETLSVLICATLFQNLYFLEIGKVSTRSVLRLTTWGTGANLRGNISPFSIIVDLDIDLTVNGFQMLLARKTTLVDYYLLPF